MVKILFPLLMFCLGYHLTAKEQINTDRPKVGLVLSGGGALGFAHIGALKVLDSLGIRVDYVAGTSFGGLIGGLYSIGYSGDSMVSIINRVDWADLFNDQPKREVLPFAEKKYSGRYNIRLPLEGFTPTLPSGVIAGQKISLFFSRLTYNYAEVTDFDSLPIPFRCVGVDLLTGNQVVMKKGPLARAMRATMAIPSAFTPVEYGDSLLSDGGLLNNYPVDVLRAMGADIIIGVDVSGYTFTREDAKKFFKVMDRAASIPRYQRLPEFVSMTDVYIEPNTDGFTIADFDHNAATQLIERGYAAALTKADTLKGLKKYLDAFHDTLFAQPRIERKPKKLKVHGIQIVGNEKLDFSFIYSLLDITPGSIFSPEIVDRRITELYALGYFETITYATKAVTDSSAELIITVTEKQFRELNIGLRYDEFYQLVGIIGVRSTNMVLSGVRFESELEFAGLFRSWAKLSYPSRSLDQPVYPFVTLRYKDIPFRIFTPTSVFQYKYRSAMVGLGVGFMVDKSWSVETELIDEATNVISKTMTSSPRSKDGLRYLASTMTLDFLDDVVVPKTGVNILAYVEYSPTFLGSQLHYTVLQFQGMNYFTPSNRHTFALGGGFYKIFDSPPFYKNFFIGGPAQFAGADYLQITGTKFIIARGEYRYEYKRDIFLKGIFNVLIDPDVLNPVTPNGAETKLGFGAGVMFTSILGPIEITVVRGDKSYVAKQGSQLMIHFSAGMKF